MCTYSYIPEIFHWYETVNVLVSAARLILFAFTLSSNYSGFLFFFALSAPYSGN